MNDLLGHAIAPAKPEAAALMEVLKALRAHPAVSWYQRVNSGAAKVGNRFIRFGWVGCPDVLGQLTDGRLLGVEVKAAKGKLSPEQAAFLQRVRLAGGVAFMARDGLDVSRELDEAIAFSKQCRNPSARPDFDSALTCYADIAGNSKRTV